MGLIQYDYLNTTFYFLKYQKCFSNLSSRIGEDWHTAFSLMLLVILDQILLVYVVLVFLIAPIKPFDPERLDTFELSHL